MGQHIAAAAAAAAFHNLNNNNLTGKSATETVLSRKVLYIFIANIIYCKSNMNSFN